MSDASPVVALADVVDETIANALAPVVIDGSPAILENADGPRIAVCRRGGSLILARERTRMLPVDPAHKDGPKHEVRDWRATARLTDIHTAIAGGMLAA